MVVEFTTGVVNDNPVPKAEPPEDELYHETVADELAVNNTVPGPHRDPLVTTGASGVCEIIACTETRILLQVLPSSK